MDLSYFETVNDDGDISYIRPETKSRDALERVISLNKPLSVVDKFVALYLTGVQWNWLKAYQSYLVELEAVNAHNANLPVIDEDEEGNDVLAEPKAIPVEPVRPELLTVEEFKSNNAELFNSYNKKHGCVIAGQRISLNKDNADGLVSIKTAYDLTGKALFPTNFIADTQSGTVNIPLNDYDEYVDFAMSFLIARGEFFK